jgi:hypothetical protein
MENGQATEHFGPALHLVRWRHTRWRSYDNYKEMLRGDLVYYEGNRIHSTDFRKPLRMNYKKGVIGIQKLLSDNSRFKPKTFKVLENITYVCIYTRIYNKDVHTQVNMHVCLPTQVYIPVSDCLQENIHQTCTYIEEYAYTHKLHERMYT